jgi:hypothetical protein
MARTAIDDGARGHWRSRSCIFRGLGVFLTLGIAASTSGGCGPTFDDTGTCENSVDACAEQEVCWPDRSQAAFTCLPEPDGAGDVGDPCEIRAGVPDCRHGLFCFTPVGGSDGICSQRCDPAADSAVCPSGVCTRLHVGDVGVIGVCRL